MAILEGVPAYLLGLSDMIDARSLVTNPAGFGKVQNVIGYAVHHSVTQMAATATEADERLHIQAIDRYHASIGYGGFGYCAAAFPSGRSYLCGNLDSQRAHVKGRNHELIGVVAIGTFTDKMPEGPQMQAIHDCLDTFRGTFGLLPTKGHGAWALPGEGTACPGQLGQFHWDDPTNPPALKEIDFLRAFASAGQFARMGWNPKDLAEIDKRALRDFVIRMA